MAEVPYVSLLIFGNVSHELITMNKLIILTWTISIVSTSQS